MQAKSLKKVKEVRGQLKEIMEGLGVKLISCQGKMDFLRRAICAGYFSNAGRFKTIWNYTQLRTGLSCSLHPSSSLFLLGYPPDYVIYHVLLMTSKEYMLCVTTVNPLWLAEFGNVFYKIKDREKIEGVLEGFSNSESRVSGVNSQSDKDAFTVFKYEDNGVGLSNWRKKKGFKEVISLDEIKVQSGFKTFRVGTKNIRKTKKKKSKFTKVQEPTIGKRSNNMFSIQEEEEDDTLAAQKPQKKQEKKPKIKSRKKKPTRMKSFI